MRTIASTSIFNMGDSSEKRTSAAKPRGTIADKQRESSGDETVVDGTTERLAIELQADKQAMEPRKRTLTAAPPKSMKLQPSKQRIRLRKQKQKQKQKQNHTTAPLPSKIAQGIRDITTLSQKHRNDWLANNTDLFEEERSRKVN
jgi:hypothetical protein